MEVNICAIKSRSFKIHTHFSCNSSKKPKVVVAPLVYYVHFNYINALKGTVPDYFEVVRYSFLQELPEVKSSKDAEKQKSAEHCETNIAED